MILEDNLKYSIYFELYKNLLTSKQQNFLNDYLNKNLSISELATIYKSSRQAVNDLLRRTLKVLDDYENKLHLFKKFDEIKSKIAKIKNLTDSPSTKDMLDSILEVL